MPLARRLVALSALALLSASLTACGASERQPDEETARTGTGAKPTDIVQESSDETPNVARCIEIWNRPGNVANQRRADQLGARALAVVVAGGFAIWSDDPPDSLDAPRSKANGCLFIVYRSGADGWPAEGEYLAFVGGTWRDIETVEPELAASHLVEASVSIGGTLEQAPAKGRASKLGYSLSVLRIVETYYPRASQLFSELVAGDGLTTDECGGKAREFHEQLRLVLGELEQLHPPAEIEALVAEFLARSRESVAAIGEAATAAERTELGCGMPMNRRIYGLPSTERAERVLDELEELGYVFRGQ